MSVVVERGLARCPRCVAVADYAFVESGLGVVRYEVHCTRCGQTYTEVHTLSTPEFTAAVAAPPSAVPNTDRTIGWHAAHGQRILQWCNDTRARLRRRTHIGS